MKCIWCSREEPYVSFLKEAHIIPRSLGGTEICKEVCDECNAFFGSPTRDMPAVELAFKELFNVSRFFILDGIRQRKKAGRYKSTYFSINFERHTIRPKPRYLQRWTQNRIAKLLRRGFYKIFLESRSLYFGDAHSSQFDYIREFSRYDLNDLPVFYFPPKMPAILFSENEASKPMIDLSESQMRIMEDFNVFQFRLMSHQFALPITQKLGPTYFNEYLKYASKEFKNTYPTYVLVKNFTDIDFTFRILDDN